MTLWLIQSYTYNVSLTHTHTRWWGPFGGRRASDVQSHWESQHCFLHFSHLSTRWISVSRRFGITWDMSHVPSRRRSLNFCKACENLSCRWSGLVFTLLWIVLKSPVCSQEEPEGMASSSGISHSPVTLPQLSLPPVKGHGGQWPRWGSGTTGRHVLFTSSLLMCGLACFNWHVAFARVSVAFVGVTVLTLS